MQVVQGRRVAAGGLLRGFLRTDVSSIQLGALGLGCGSLLAPWCWFRGYAGAIQLKSKLIRKISWILQEYGYFPLRSEVWA